MDKHYNSHSIHVFALLNPYTKRFKPGVRVTFAVGGLRNRVIPLLFPATVDFPDRKAAELYALEHAKAWLDDGGRDSLVEV